MGRRFNGTTDKVTIRTGFLLPAPPITIAAWANPSGSGQGSIIGTVGSGGIEFAVEAATNKHLYLIVSGVALAKQSSGTIANGVWTHIAMNTDAAPGGTVNFYIRGSLDLSAGTGYGGVYTAQNALIGNVSSNEPYAGILADVAVWNVVLTAAEHLMLGQGLRAKYVRPDNLIGCWPLIGRSQYEPDLTRYANYGTTTGTASAPDPPFLIPDRNKIFYLEPEGELPILSAAGFLSGWSRQSNLPVIGGGTF